MIKVSLTDSFQKLRAMIMNLAASKPSKKRGWCRLRSGLCPGQCLPSGVPSTPLLGCTLGAVARTSCVTTERRAGGILCASSGS